MKEIQLFEIYFSTSDKAFFLQMTVWSTICFRFKRTYVDK